MIYVRRRLLDIRRSRLKSAPLLRQASYGVVFSGRRRNGLGGSARFFSNWVKYVGVCGIIV